MKKSSITTLTLLPGQVWTAQGRFAVDALKLSVLWEENQGENIRPKLVTIHEVHELNVVGRRHTNDTRFSLRRSVEQFVKEGITFYYNDAFHTVLPPKVKVTSRFRIRAFVLDDPDLGPFSGETFQQNE